MKLCKRIQSEGRVTNKLVTSYTIVSENGLGGTAFGEGNNGSGIRLMSQ